MNKILIFLGTRPEVIKLAPVVKAFKKHSTKIDVILCSTGQHSELLEPFLKYFNLKPEYRYELMRKNQDLDQIFSRIFQKASRLLTKIKPDFIIVQGDTTSAAACALAAFLKQVKIAHVEAGLRSGNNFSPFPEELNRKLIDQLSEVLFAPTQTAVNNLTKEGLDNIILTGNTVIDSLRFIQKKSKEYYKRKKIILVTIHRRENINEGLIHIFNALKKIAMAHQDYKLIFPVHLNPKVLGPAYRELKNTPNIKLLKPLNYLAFLKLLRECRFVLTDSGGVVEEAAYYGRPVLILRKETERLESIRAGVAELIGTQENKIIMKTENLIRNHKKYLKMSKKISDYGQGNSAQLIVEFFLSNYYKNG